MALFKKDDKSINKDYSQISDVNELIKKLADECAKTARKNKFKDIFNKDTDDLLEAEIAKFTNRFKELNKKEPNIIQKWFS
ncbi:MAG: hypothetical protein M0R51_00550 [Clostridia bacterium]|jgi:hypothetical protein|nr:hypothetical protein [Clostridia bacterium]